MPARALLRWPLMSSRWTVPSPSQARRQPSGSTLARARMAPEQPMAPARWMSVAWPVYRPAAISSASRRSRSASPELSLMPGDRELAEHVDGHARRRHLRVVVGEHRDVDGGGDPLVVGPRVGDAGGGEDEQRVGAVVRGPPRQHTACRADGAPVPASTGTRPSTADRTAISRSLRSSSSRAAASPVVPATTHGLDARRRPAGRRGRPWPGHRSRPRSSKRVTRATPTPVNGAGRGHGRQPNEWPTATVGPRWLCPASPTSATPCRRSSEGVALHRVAPRRRRPGRTPRPGPTASRWATASARWCRAPSRRRSRRRRRSPSGGGARCAEDDRLREAVRPWIGTGLPRRRAPLPPGRAARRAGSRTPTSPPGCAAAVDDALAAAGGRAGRRRHPRARPVDPPRRPAGRRLRPGVVLEPPGLPRRVGARRDDMLHRSLPARRSADAARRSAGSSSIASSSASMSSPALPQLVAPSSRRRTTIDTTSSGDAVVAR